LIFLGSLRATVAVFLSIPLSALATFIALWAGGSSVNTMILGGLALAFSRLIDNSVVVLENIFRHLELGEPPEVAAEKGGREVALPVLASTLTTVVVFFPVTFLYGVSKFLFSALALAVVLSLFASYIVALTVVPLFCAKLLKGHVAHGEHQEAESETGEAIVKVRKSFGQRFNDWFNSWFGKLLNGYSNAVGKALQWPRTVVFALLGLFVFSLLLYPLLGVAFFPRTDAGQFVVNIKAPSGTRLEVTESEVEKVEGLIRQVVSKEDLGMIVSNIGVTPGFSSIYTSNSAQHTAFVQVSLTEEHKVGSYEYMNRVRERLSAGLPHLSTYFQSGGLVDAVLNMGLPAPIDVQVSGSNLEANYEVAVQLARQIRQLSGVSDVYIPQDLDYPALQLDVDRTHASQLGLTQKEIVHNVITALTSNQMIAPSYWIDPKSGNDYLLTVQFPEGQVKTLADLQGIPLRSAKRTDPTRLDAVSSVARMQSPTEVDHYQLRRIINLYVAPSGEDLGKVANAIDELIGETKLPAGVRIDLRGMVQGMRASFSSFGIGLSLAVVLLFLILVASFRSFKDPFLILLAVPPGVTGVLITLYLTGTTLNVQSLMGVVMMVGIVVSNSILIVEFTHRLREDGLSVREAVVTGARVRLRPIIMSTLATLMGLLPMALNLGTGSEAYAPLARAILGGLMLSVTLTIFVVPAAYFVLYRKHDAPPAPVPTPEPLADEKEGN
jgi:multidrug efflux pump subunit AcrB